MATISKVVREIVTVDPSGNEIVNNIGSDERRVLADNGTRTVEQKFDDYALKSETTRVFRGEDQPTDMRDGDIWLRPVGSVEISDEAYNNFINRLKNRNNNA